MRDGWVADAARTFPVGPVAPIAGKLLTVTEESLLLAGQVHGGIGQGIGQALIEETRFDDSGQMLTASFMDYAMPRAGDLPNYDFSWEVVTCRTNPLGIKGCGEAGTIGAPPAVMNALLDALAPLGITDLQMPATARRVWEAMRAATA